MRVRGAVWFVSGMLLGVLSWGCGESEESVSEKVPTGEGCVPGRSLACVCDSGAAGVQTCSAARAFGPCACPAVADGDAPEASDSSATSGDEGEAASMCGNGTLEPSESCDDGNAQTEPCTYGEKTCRVCGPDCREVAGTASFCGDGKVDAENGEACDAPGASPFCAYGARTCEVCGPQCQPVAGRPAFCGDGVTDSRHESCDGELFCDAGCSYIGERWEPNDDLTRAVKVGLDAQGRYVHPMDMVFGPMLVVGGKYHAESPDLFAVEVCNGGTLTAELTFDNTLGNLDLRIGRMPQQGSPSGPPPVEFNWSSASDTSNVEKVTVAAPAPGQLKRTHYVLVEADDDSRVPLRNAYNLVLTVTGCS